MAIVIRSVTPDELFNDAAFPALVDAYRQEAARDAALVNAPPDWEAYRQAFARGELVFLGVFSTRALP